MKACFADNAVCPIACSWDIGEVHNCLLASRGTKRDDCQYWQPGRTVTLVLDILGVDLGDTMKCFGARCAGCKDFFACEMHFPPGCWGDL